MINTFVRKGLLAVTVSLLGMSGASAAIQIPVSGTVYASRATPVTFWAQPYPYRYVPWRRCPIVRVETPYGWYMDRVCAPVGPILRRAY